MKKYLIGLFAFAIMLFPMMVNAETITEASAPVYYEVGQISEKQTRPFFVANGTPIVIEERDGNTYITWEGGERLVTADAVVLGGYYNPYNTDNSVTGIDIASTSIKMTGGEVAFIVGGNGVDANYNQYEVIHVGTIDVEMTGGTVREISGTSAALSGIINTALGASYYEDIESFYYADKVDITVDNAVVTGRVYVTSSYTYAKEATINVVNGADIQSANILLNGEPVLPVSLSAGTNGKVDTFVTNIEDSSVDQIDLGLRVMVDNFTVNITGDSEIGDIYAGAELPVAAKSNNTDLWKSIGTVPYGQAANMEFNIGEGVTYNNIYAGFQFATLEGASEYDTFYTKFASESAINSTAAGLGADAKEAPVVINTSVAPSVTDSDLESMFNFDGDNVTVKYTATSEVPSIPSGSVSTPTFGVVNEGAVSAILGEAASTNEDALKAVAEGINVSAAIEVTEIETPEEEIVAKVEEALAKQNENGVVVGYFDVSVLLKNTLTNETISNISELASPIELTVALPSELQTVSEGYTRAFYVIREHNGKVELLETSLASDGKSLTFETDKFSTYALTYVDTLASSETPTTPENPSEETPEVPQTFDSLTTYMIGGGVSIAAIAGAVIYIKRKQTN